MMDLMWNVADKNILSTGDIMTLKGFRSKGLIRHNVIVLYAVITAACIPPRYKIVHVGEI